MVRHRLVCRRICPKNCLVFLSGIYRGTSRIR
ncbi:hypothetical protein AFE_1151 [Acidithiobacillus ferrooxidans ATCC 23270]|uniref:Uncharacterized protein n=1 Tax=Acidithiobacillus ferrooxidans (strain ATCC 23270 / DSM 14882 / CIP 104768 / NCIMB 8455) TaxID=243159 RepID=B7J899_ACIF2|nr:hypothetical protein AFE_1151 [Acidithiobacillus ferrooxidans ATCC 23270]